MIIEIKSCKEVAKTPSVPSLVKNNNEMIVLVTWWECNYASFSGVVIDSGKSKLFKAGCYAQHWDKSLFSLLPSSTKVILSND